MDQDFKSIPLSYDPATKQLTTTSTDPLIADELTALNALHKALTAPSNETPNGVPPPPSAVNPRRSAQITKLRDSGNAAFRASKYPDAVRLYTLGIEMASGRPPWEPSVLAREELSQLYANRAQAHMAMQGWAEGAVDALCSVNLKRQGNTKAWWRRGKCLVEMGRAEEARKWLLEAIEIEGPEADLKELLEGVKKTAEKKG